MKIENLLVVALLAAPCASRAAAVTADDLDTLVVELKDSLDKTERCFKTEASLLADRAAKEAQLAREFNGKVPRDFSELLLGKSRRALKQRQLCVQLHTDLGKQLEAAELAFRTLGVTSGERREDLDAVITKHHLMLPRGKRRN